MISTYFELTIDKPLDMSKRAWQSALKEAHQTAAELWREEMLPEHYTASAAQRYGYQARSGQYLMRKLRACSRGQAVPGMLPLVYSGRTRADSMATAVARGFPTRLKVTMQNPRYIEINPRDPKKPRLAAEQVAVTQDELQRLSELVAEKVSEAIDRYSERQVHKSS